MNVLLLDNDDPDVSDLHRLLAELGAAVSVQRSDEIEVDEIAALAPDRIVISSGPDDLAESGISLPLIRELGIDIPILGVGLGYAAIGAAFGGRVVPVEGRKDPVTARVEHAGAGVFRGLPSPLTVSGDYASIVDQTTLPETLAVTAWCSVGLIMGLRHRTLPVEGIRFSPSSSRTEYGKDLLGNFLDTDRRRT